MMNLLRIQSNDCHQKLQYLFSKFFIITYRYILYTIRNLYFLSKNSALIFQEIFQIFRGKVMIMFQFCTFISREKLSKIFWVKKIVKMFQFCTFQLLTTLVSRKKLSKYFWVKKIVKILVLHFSIVDNFNFTKKIVEKFLDEKTR